jgi:hypothetical protein
MKRATVIALMLAISGLSFYSALHPEWSRRYFPFPIKNESFLKAMRIFVGILALLGALLLLYGAFMPTLPED